MCRGVGSCAGGSVLGCEQGVGHARGARDQLARQLIGGTGQRRANHRAIGRAAGVERAQHRALQGGPPVEPAASTTSSAWAPRSLQRPACTAMEPSRTPVCPSGVPVTSSAPDGPGSRTMLFRRDQLRPTVAGAGNVGAIARQEPGDERGVAGEQVDGAAGALADEAAEQDTGGVDAGVARESQRVERGRGACAHAHRRSVGAATGGEERDSGDGGARWRSSSTHGKR